MLEQLSTHRSEGANYVEGAMNRVRPDRETVTAEMWAQRLSAEINATFPGQEQQLLVLIDQFEEIFTQRGFVAISEDERQERIKLVLDGLALLAQGPDQRLHFIFTLRSDFYDRCAASEAFWKLISVEHRSMELDELDEEGWREAIKGPAARAGAYLEAGLVERMIKDVYRQRGSMPLLQLALQDLWPAREGACLTHAAYLTMGGVANALQKRAEKVLDQLKLQNAEYLEIARNLFLRLVSSGEGVADTRRRLDRSETDWPSIEKNKIDHVIGKLSGPEARLIVADGEFLEITHEVLIRGSKTVWRWIERSRADIAVLRRLTHAARRWEEHQRTSLYLNAGDPAKEMERWVDSTNLKLTCLELAYWRASADRVWWQATLWNGLLAGAFAVLLAGVVAALGLYHKAEIARKSADAATVDARRALGEAIAARNEAQGALARALVHTIGLAAGKAPTSDGRSALWELAQLDRSNVAVRQKVIDEWCRDEQMILQAFGNCGQGWRAVVGTNAEIGNFAADRARRLSERLMKSSLSSSDVRVMEALGVSANCLDPSLAGRLAHKSVDGLVRADLDDRDSFAVWRDTLVAVAPKLDDSTRESVVTDLIRGLDALPLAVDDKKHFYITEPLVALVANLPRESARQMVKKISEIFVDGNYPDPDGEQATVKVLRTLGASGQPLVEPETAENLLSLLENTPRMDANSQLVRTEALDALLRMVEAPARSALATRGAAFALRIMKGGGVTEPSERAHWTSTLAYLLYQADGPDSARLSAEVTDFVLAELMKHDPNEETEISTRVTYDLVLDVVARKASPDQCAKLVKALGGVLLKKFAQPDAFWFSVHFSLPRAASGLNRGSTDDTSLQLVRNTVDPQIRNVANRELLDALGPKMSSPAAIEATDLLIEALEKKQDDFNFKDTYVAFALAATVRGIDQPNSLSKAARGADAIVRVMERSSAYDDRLNDLAQALSVLASLSPQAGDARRRGIDILLHEMKELRPDDEDKLAPLCSGIHVLARTMEPAAAADIGARAMMILLGRYAHWKHPRDDNNDCSNLSAFGAALLELAPLLPHARQTRLAAFSFFFLKFGWSNRVAEFDN